MTSVIDYTEDLLELVVDATRVKVKFSYVIASRSASQLGSKTCVRGMFSKRVKRASWCGVRSGEQGSWGGSRGHRGRRHIMGRRNVHGGPFL